MTRLRKSRGSYDTSPPCLIPAGAVFFNRHESAPRQEPGPSSALTYVKISLGPQALEQTPFKPRDDLDLMGAVDEVMHRLQGHVDALLLRDDRPMAARIRPDVARRYRGDYDQLARTDEWTIAAGDDSP